MGTTIRDVAQAANVSIGTVSRALKNQPGLSEATRARIVEIAHRMNYDPTQLRPRIKRLTFLLHRQHNNFATTPCSTCEKNGVVAKL
uniref:LacI family DNA-binding transcriptional regulator n=1 Tax=Burkholderia pseudomallei TaxID=28450 RepID=UPI000A6935D1